MENKQLESALKIKLLHLTVEGARDFWNEICEDLDSQIRLCDLALKDFKLPELEIRKAQIQRWLCERLKGLPERMVVSIQAQLADKSGEADDLNGLNFLSPDGRKTEE
jgi:hypothetical protein